MSNNENCPAEPHRLTLICDLDLMYSLLLTSSLTVLYIYSKLAFETLFAFFRLALQGYSVASLPRALRLHLPRFAHETRKILKKSVSQSTRNTLKLIEMQKENITPLTLYTICA